MGAYRFLALLTARLVLPFAVCFAERRCLDFAPRLDAAFAERFSAAFLDGTDDTPRLRESERVARPGGMPDWEELDDGSGGSSALELELELELERSSRANTTGAAALCLPCNGIPFGRIIVM